MKNKLLPSDWKKVKLEEICDVRDGTHESPKYVKNGYPLITSKNLTNGYIDLSEVNFISKEDFDNINKRSKVDKGDILMPMIGTVGNPVIVDVEVNFAIKNVALIKFNNKKLVLNSYIKFLFDSPYFDYITSNVNRGGTQKFIALKDIRAIVIPLPPLETQKKIVEILEKAEELKQKRELANKLTQEYLKSVFYEIFLNNRNKFGLIKGADLFEFAYGKGLSEEERDDGEYPVYGSNGKVGSHSTSLVKGPGIVVGRKGSIGEVNFVKKDFWPIDTTYYVKPLKKSNFWYLYYLLKSYNLKLNKSAAIPGLNRNDVYSIKFVDAPIDLQNKFAAIVEHVEEMKEKQLKNKEYIGEMFNSLMQKAFSGELVQ